MLKFIHTFAISLALSLPPSLTAFLLLLSAAVFWLFLRSTVKNYKRMVAKGGQSKNSKKRTGKNIWHFFFLLLCSLLCVLCCCVHFFSFASRGIYIFKWKVKLIINCEEKVAAYVFVPRPASLRLYFQLYEISLPVVHVSLCVFLQSSGQIFILVALSGSHIICPLARIIKSDELISRCT